MGTNKPLRIEIYDDSIKSLRYFNTDTQLTEKKIVAIDILPAKEIPLDEKSIRYFRSCYREKFEGNPTDSQLYLDISNGISHGGIEYYLPLFFDNTATFFDYFSKDNLIIAPNNLIDILTKYWTDIKNRHDIIKEDYGQSLLEPDEAFLTLTTIKKILKNLNIINFSHFALKENKDTFCLLYTSPSPRD